MNTYETTEPVEPVVDTLTDRLTSTAIEAVLGDDLVIDGPSSWVRPVVMAIQEQLAAELIAHEQLAERPLSLQNAVVFLLDGAGA